jgi:hypothetical protein
MSEAFRFLLPKTACRYCGLLAAAVLLGACSAPTPRYYADAGHAVASYAEIRSQLKPAQLHVEVRFQHRGADDAAAAAIAREDLLQVLQRLGRFEVTDDPQAPAELSVEISGTYAPAQRGGDQLLIHDLLYGTRLDDAVVDPLHFQIVYRQAGEAPRVARYDHALLATLGDHAPSRDDRGPFDDPNAALSVAIEDVVLHFFKDLQGSAPSQSPLVYLP